MNQREKGFLLLTSQLGVAERKPLTLPQLRRLAERMQYIPSIDSNAELFEEDLLKLGCSRSEAEKILNLLDEEELLDYYLRQGRRQDCYPVTRANAEYPLRIRKFLGLESPGSLWLKGDRNLLEAPKISLVGSRDLEPNNRRFARAVGEYAALQGITLVSGNARGADREAQEACLVAGGTVISIVADELSSHPLMRNVLFVSEDGYSEAFSTQRALSRNRCIHTLGSMTFVAQCSLGKGGTWDGTTRNLSHGWSPVFCFRDGSMAAAELENRGAALIEEKDLQDFFSLASSQVSFWDI